MNINNINNQGFVYAVDNNIYYSNISSDDGKLYKTTLDLNKTHKLSDIKDVKYIQKYNNEIYYVSENKIYALNLHSSENKIIFSNDEWISDMLIINEDMFFSTNDENSTQYVMHLDTAYLEKIFEDSYGFNIYQNKLYYSGNKNKGIYSFNLVTRESIKLISDNVDLPIIKENELYYFSLSDKHFYKLNLDNNLLLKLEIDSSLYNFSRVNYYNIVLNNLIFSKNGLFKYNLETKQTQLLHSLNADSINIINNEIWFVSYSNNKFDLFKTDINGSKLVHIK